MSAPSATRPQHSTPATPGQPLRQQSAVGLAVLGLHALAIAALTWLGVSHLLPDAPAVLNVRWLAEQPAPRPEAPPTPQRHDTVQTPQKTVSPPRQETPPLIQAAADAPSTQVSARIEEPAPVAASAGTQQAAAPIAAPAPRAVAPSEPQKLNPSADCPVRPAPRYHDSSIRLGEEGQVVLRAQLDARGAPVHTEIYSSSGFSRLDRAALEAFKQYRCHTQNNPDKWFTILFDFHL